MKLFGTHILSKIATEYVKICLCFKDKKWVGSKGVEKLQSKTYRWQTRTLTRGEAVRLCSNQTPAPPLCPAVTKTWDGEVHTKSLSPANLRWFPTFTGQASDSNLLYLVGS